ncbi:DUF1801 domain-containing protein [Dyadobacter arcticus]|uniref:YdhG-like domain-containing protein n=1 Tax=Dyadobacter arcticus TaxID=1078754 RepID=A0ABX0UT54_9BACT|nr:DUF1801 domain-containing protein [Dyadobacter arcticus]NIJ54156.1 hypothetical protein [Dyadobacter arcticus]
MAEQKNKSVPKTRAPKLTDAEQVSIFMDHLDHPLKAEIEALRIIIKNVHPEISERVKWNAPSYYTSADFLTFNPRMTNKVHLIFHHIAIVDIKSPLLEGTYKDRRMTYFENMADVEAKKPELERILKEIVGVMEK